MIAKSKELFLKHKELILYVFFGGMTTAVNFVVYFFCSRIFGFGTAPADVVAWALSVLFAFIVNKIWVFESRNWAASVAVREFVEFVGARVVSLLAELLIMVVAVDVFLLWDVPVKIAANILVIVMNYIFSKLVIFKKKEECE